jgi:hypothetical protein
METDQINSQKIIKHIMEVAPKHCENCGNKYSENDFKVMKSTSVNTLLHLKCSNCGNTYMLNVVSPMQGMVGASRMPLNLDIYSSNEFSKFAGRTPTKKDEAIDIYDSLGEKNFDSFMKKLISDDSTKS